jgi:hypothetical protein
MKSAQDAGEPMTHLPPQETQVNCGRARRRRALHAALMMNGPNFIKVDQVEAYAVVGRLGIGDPVVLVCGDIEVTVTVNKLERSRRLRNHS